ncbi:MAG: hypothetical protein KC478_16350 [Bacteriovoracaceae bacterium]|nr:hypothetical protein [Bacteriovoracaceae bacterium]
MKSLILGLLFIPALFASTGPQLVELELASYKGSHWFSSCNLEINEDDNGMIYAVFTRGQDKYQSRPVRPDANILASSNGQVWYDFPIDNGLIHATVMFNNEQELIPTRYTVLEGRTGALIKCKRLKLK